MTMAVVLQVLMISEEVIHVMDVVDVVVVVVKKALLYRYQYLHCWIWVFDLLTLLFVFLEQPLYFEDADFLPAIAPFPLANSPSPLLSFPGL